MLKASWLSSSVWRLSLYVCTSSSRVWAQPHQILFQGQRNPWASKCPIWRQSDELHCETGVNSFIFCFVFCFFPPHTHLASSNRASHSPELIYFIWNIMFILASFPYKVFFFLSFHFWNVKKNILFKFFQINCSWWCKLIWYSFPLF